MNMSNPDEGKTTIIVNGRRKEVSADQLSFDQVVLLAFGEIKPNFAYTMTYKAGPKENPEGSMSSGDSVRIKNGMHFNVTATDKS
jgi:hypothetical protein